MRVGILANEFLDPTIGRVGGFGWAAREAARALSSGGTEIAFLSGELHERTVGPRPRVHGWPLVPRRRNRIAYVAALRRLRLDLVLGIDFRPSYASVLRALAATPLIVWVRDPRGPDEVRRVGTLRVPGSAARPSGVDPVDCTALGRVVRRGRRQTVLASPAPEFLAPRAEACYGLPSAELAWLPNPVPTDVSPRQKSPFPLVVFLGRLDPYKRPWVAVEVARRMPHIEFTFLGRPHFSGPGSWTADDLPDNVRLAGHVDGEAKQRIVASAWALINTSINEGLPVSFLEAFVAQTPIVSGVDPDGLVSRFGISVGLADGDGLEAVPAYVEALETLVRRHDRHRLGVAAREWVLGHHTPQHFLAAFDELLRHMNADRRLRARSVT